MGMYDEEEKYDYYSERRREKWYIASDIDKRIKFYNAHYDGHSDFEREYFNLYKRKKAEIEEYDYFSGWLFDFCFTNLDKDFEEMIK